MEEWVYFVIIGMIGAFSVVGLKILKPNKAKTKVKSSIQDANEVLRDIDQETITRLKTTLKSESGRANRLQALKNDEEPPEEPQTDDKSATWEQIQQLVKASYPQYATFLPIFKGQILKATKGMSVQEIVSTVSGVIGGGQPKQQTAQANQENRSDFA